MDEGYPTDIAGWQSFAFRKSDIPLQSVAAEMGADLENHEARYCLKLTSERGRWVLCCTDTNSPVHLSYALPWNWSSDLETGNFVSKTESEPRKGYFSSPGNACSITYSFDTTDCDEVHGYLSTIDEWVTRCAPDFNRQGKRREVFQDPSRPFALSRLTMLCRIFEKRSRTNNSSAGRFPVTYPVHESIKEVTFPFTDWIPNPGRTRLSELVDDEVRALGGSDYPSMDRGDPTWIAFKLFYIEKRDTWMTECVPLDIVRVARQQFGRTVEPTSLFSHC